MPRKRGQASDEAPRGKYGEGSSYEYPKDSGKWFIEVPTGEGGRPIVRRAKGATTRREADAQRYALLAELEESRRLKLDFRKGEQSLEAFVNNEWWPACLSRNLAPKTLRDYRKTVTGYLLPDWGRVPLKRFDVALMIEISDRITARHSPAVAYNAIAKLSMVLNAAKRRQYISFNAVENARPELPKIKRSTPPVLTDAQLHQLFTAVEDERLCVFWHLEALIGARLGEILGIQRNDIEWETGLLTIRRQVQEVGGKVVIREYTKNAAGMNRLLPLPPRVLGRLRTHVMTIGASTWLFPNEEGNPMIQSNFARSWHGGVTSRYIGADGKQRTKTIVGIRQKANLPSNATLHGFRHTANNRMMQLGVPPEVRQKIFGWGKKGIEQHYTDADLFSIRQALALAEQTLWEHGSASATDDTHKAG